MRQTNILLSILMLTLMISSCIKTFTPEIRSQDEQKYVVTGQVTDGDGSQTVNVSMTSSINKPEYLPITGCSIKITDIEGHEFPMSETGNGDYNTWIDPVFLIPGAYFHIVVVTPSGDSIISDYDQFAASPEIDSLYYVRKDIVGNAPGQLIKGIQFYVDLDANFSNSHYYRWELIETWEYHSDYILEWYYDGTVHHISPPDYSKHTCWSTILVPNIFTLSTENLVENKYSKFALNYVNNRTPRLVYGYSLLLKQFALSLAAFTYWDQLRINSTEGGGLYEKQPLAVKGNLRNLTHPSRDVLGFFGAASLRTKRIFLQNVADLPLENTTSCFPIKLLKGLSSIKPSSYPAYLAGDESGYRMLMLDEKCVNCLKLGGTNVKPDFWPN